ncbi:MAG: proline--tRNA ligase [Bacteriovoracaceae bacterium]|jgi:prolyl-tRNA synthetase|nr:proline--tRNA ligase [Bacteriovoracaceae bacterium]
MKLSRVFWQTLKEVPSDAQIASHRLLVRAGFISKSAAGLYNLLPMSQRVLRKIENIIREELDKINSNEVSLSFVTPSELWKESGRWDTMGPEMVRFVDRKSNDFCLSPTNEEAMVDVFRKSITSYKSLPVNLYQIKTKVRDEIRPRFGLMRCKEFTMKDAYSFSIDKASLDTEYENYYQAYSNIFKRMGLDFIIVEADGGNMASGDAKTHEFQVVATAGEDLVVTVPDLGYAANIEKAQTFRGDLDFTDASDIEKIETIDLKTCEDVCKSLNVPVYQSLKTLIFEATYGKKTVPYMVLLLGDDEINEVKLKNFLGADHLSIASEDTLKDLAVPKGYMSPYNLEKKVSVLYDASIDVDKSYIVGANEENYHVKGFVPSRDTQSFKQADFRMAKESDFGPDKKSKVVFKRGVEVGHIFQLGDKYTKSMKVTVLDQNAKAVTPLMGCYGIGVTRTMAAAIEQHHDENGIMWPKAIAPYHVYFAKIGKKDETKDLCDKIYNDFIEAGVEVLYDDRGMGPGPMFKDADLLGLPLRVVLGERDFEKDGTVEIKVRSTGESLKVSVSDVIVKTKEILDKL